MTRDEIARLTDKKLRIEVAKIAGWTMPKGSHFWLAPDSIRRFVAPPDFLNDLGAINYAWQRFLEVHSGVSVRTMQDAKRRGVSVTTGNQFDIIEVASGLNKSMARLLCEALVEANDKVNNDG